MRCLYVCEGPSDVGIAEHIERIAANQGAIVDITVPDYSLLEERVGGRVEDKVRAGIALGGEFDFIAAHRDRDTASVEERREEIRSAVRACDATIPYIAVIPVRMTESWLILEEQSIRRVAANPNGKVDLNLPTYNEAERMADPKAFLKYTLATASGVTGRKLKRFNDRFGQHRAQLLQGLDPDGAVSRLQSWRAFVQETEAAINSCI